METDTILIIGAIAVGAYFLTGGKIGNNVGQGIGQSAGGLVAGTTEGLIKSVLTDPYVWASTPASQGGAPAYIPVIDEFAEFENKIFGQVPWNSTPANWIGFSLPFIGAI